MIDCVICEADPAIDNQGFCRLCCASYDRARRRDDGTVFAAMVWAAKRARWAVRRKELYDRRSLDVL